MTNDVFDDRNEISGGTYFNFKEIGDKISGVYAGFYDNEGQFGEQRNYRLQTEEGSFQVSFRTNKVFVINAMENAEEGDIVGFKFTDTVDTGKGNPAKNIKVYLQKREKKITQPGFNDDTEDTKKTDVKEEDLPF